MTGKRYYLTTLGDWQRHAGRFANSHYISLDAPGDSAVRGADDTAIDDAPAVPGASTDATTGTSTGAIMILALVEADEGAHLALEDDPAFEALPHALAQKPIPDRAQAALAPLGVAPAATTFDVAEILARVHPLLRHRVF